MPDTVHLLPSCWRWSWGLPAKRVSNLWQYNMSCLCSTGYLQLTLKETQYLFDFDKRPGLPVKYGHYFCFLFFVIFAFCPASAGWAVHHGYYYHKFRKRIVVDNKCQKDCWMEKRMTNLPPAPLSSSAPFIFLSTCSDRQFAALLACCH